jgi:uncharacterized protein
MEFFASYSVLLWGLISGIVFGFLLRKGLVTRFDTIVNQFLLKDFTVIKIMLTAIIVGSIGIYIMHETGLLIELPIKNAFIIANVAGGAIFGIGMAVLGLCPGTCVGAVGEGSLDGFFGLLGMLLGAVLFAEVYDVLHPLFFEQLNFGKITLVDLTGWSPWFFIGFLTVFSLIAFPLIERYEKGQKK